MCGLFWEGNHRAIGVCNEFEGRIPGQELDEPVTAPWPKRDRTGVDITSDIDDRANDIPTVASGSTATVSIVQ